MYQVGQQVLYGIHGVCSVTAIEPMRFGKEKTDYYLLQPLAQPDSKYYVPVRSASAVAKLRPLLTKQELLELLHSENVRQDLWIADENQRKLQFREILARGDRAEILSMISTLYRHKKKQQSAGRKFHLSDETFLKDAEKLIHAEFSHILAIEPSQVSAFILREMSLCEEAGAEAG